MLSIQYSLYTAFSDSVSGGSRAAIIYNTKNFSPDFRLQIARKLNLPAICFVESHTGNSVTARFQSTEREYPMCGHGTICLMSDLIGREIFEWPGTGTLSVDLRLPTTSSTVEITSSRDLINIVMLDINIPEFRSNIIDSVELASILGIQTSDYHSKLPLEFALGDFTHLVVPVSGLMAMSHINPDFEHLARFCRKNNIETVATFCTEVEDSSNAIHVRDFCPAVGVAESPAAGTTNAALSTYLIKHRLVQASGSGTIAIKAEQGLEIGSPSSIHTVAHVKEGIITRLQVGGVATKVMDGGLQLSNDRFSA